MLRYEIYGAVYLKTEVIQINPESPTSDVINSAANLIRNGELVGFPTDTLYGIGCDAFNLKATEKLFLLKERPFSKPINLLISELNQIKSIVPLITQTAKKLISEFWPGALTIIFPKKKGILENISGGLESIGVRMPNYIITLQLIKQVNMPIAATSANLSGHTSSTTVEEVIDHFQNKIPLIIDGGKTPLELGSTIVDITEDTPKILREGFIPKEEIFKVVSTNY